MRLAYAAVAVLFIVALGWIAYISSRRRLTTAQLIQQLEAARSDRLYPFVGNSNLKYSWDDDALWAAIGGREGMWQMRRECGIMITLAGQIKAENEDTRQKAEDIVVKALYLRHMMIWLCLMEASASVHLPSIPRIHARSCARLYCDMAASLEAVVSFGDRTAPINLLP